MSIPRVKIIGLGRRGDKEKIRQEFSKIGPVRDVWITTNPPVCAYVVYERLQDAERAVKIMYGKRLCGVYVTVKLSPSEDGCQSAQDKRDTPIRHQQGGRIPTSHFHSRSSSQSYSHSSPDRGKRSSRAHPPSSDYGGRQSREGRSLRDSGYTRVTHEEAGCAHSLGDVHHSDTNIGTILTEKEAHQQQQETDSGQMASEETGLAHSHSHTHHFVTEIGSAVAENKEDYYKQHVINSGETPSPMHEDAGSVHSHTPSHHSTTEMGRTVAEDKANNSMSHFYSYSHSHCHSNVCTSDYRGHQRTENYSNTGHSVKQYLSSGPAHDEVDSPHIYGHTHHSKTEIGAEYRAVLACSDKLVIAISQDPLTIALSLMAKDFISPEIHDKMLLCTLTPLVKATILVTAVRDKIKIAPKRFCDLKKIFLEQASTKDIVEVLQSAYQGTIKNEIN